MKIAMPKSVAELRECTGCHGYTQNGYELRDHTISRFACEECYRDVKEEYPLCKEMIEIRQSVLSQIVQGDRKPVFLAGYLLGRKETAEGVRKIIVTEYINGLKSHRGTVVFFAPEDVRKIRSVSKEKNCAVVALFRTNPSGSPDFNELDCSVIGDMVSTMPYVVIGGTSEIQISVRDKHYPDYEYGVTVV